MPAEGVLTATVVAPTATLADALSTAFFVMGPERTAAFCRSRPEIAALVICPTASQGQGFEVHRFGTLQYRPRADYNQGGPV
jgi:FAD:protein FMN transferase